MSNCSLRCLLLLSLFVVLQAAVWEPQLCQTREVHWTHHDEHHDDDDHHEGHDHGYIFSSQSEEKLARDWSGAQDWCQARCMDLVSLETEEEWSLVRDMMEESGAQSIWTSGYREEGQR